MRQETTSPIVLAQARTTEGAAFQLRRDSKGVLEVPGLANVLISHTSGFARCAAPGRSEPLFPGRDAGSDRRRGRDALERSAVGKHRGRLARNLNT